MPDFTRTLTLVRGALLDPETTWRSYLPEAGDWKKTALLLTGPLIIAANVVAYLLGLVFDAGLFGMFRPTIVSTIVNIIVAAAAAGVVAFIVSALAGAFGGKNSFAHGLAATTFAFVPAYLGQALVGLPWIGGLLSLGLSIYGLVLLWRIIPIYLEVPDDKRAGHYIVSLLATIVTMAIVGSVIGASRVGDRHGIAGIQERGASGTAATGVLGGIARQGELIAMAEQDSYAAPDSGKLTSRQVEEFIRVMQRVAEMQAEKQQRLEEIAEKADKEENISMSDFGEIMSGVTDIAGMQTAEIEVVKSAGGNWAEHQWVSESLRTAWIQKDINETVAHNYALYQEYEDELRQFIAR